MIGTELKIVTPAETEILGPEVDRLPTLHTNARTDRELLEVWLKSHRDGSAHTVRGSTRGSANGSWRRWETAGCAGRRSRVSRPRWRRCGFGLMGSP